MGPIVSGVYVAGPVPLSAAAVWHYSPSSTSDVSLGTYYKIIHQIGMIGEISVVLDQVKKNMI